MLRRFLHPAATEILLYQSAGLPKTGRRGLAALGCAWRRVAKTGGRAACRQGCKGHGAEGGKGGEEGRAQEAAQAALQCDFPPAEDV